MELELRSVEHQGAHTLSTRVGGAPPLLGAPPYLVGPLETLRRQLQLHILAFGEKKIREKKSSCFMIRSPERTPDQLSRERLGLGGGSVS